MPKFNPAAGQVVADDLRTTFESLDVSVQNTARLMSTFLESCEGSGLAPVVSQRALRAMGASISKIIEGRGEMINAQRVLVSIKGSSNLDVYDYGCFMQAQSSPATKDAVVTEA
ncbi:MAG: hypothetical protein QHC40_13940 [Sphingobium sp.]|nr:hypothetical protein [Sphingobium sp.]